MAVRKSLKTNAGDAPPAVSPIAPMEALLVEALPEPPGWQYEPKWDGFRAIVTRDGDRVEIWSKSGKPLGRYFPEVLDTVRGLDETHLLLDGELVVPVGTHLSFDALQARLHPAASRIARLSRETPARLILFDCLEVGDRLLAGEPLGERRAALEALAARFATPGLVLSPASYRLDQAGAWLAESGGALDGVVAKPLGQPYAAGERAMRKVKQLRTADCVVGGYRKTATGGVASLLIGLFDEAGRLDWSDSARPLAGRSARRWPRPSHRTKAGPASPAGRRVAPAAGARRKLAPISRSATILSPNLSTTRSLPGAFGMRLASCAGARTRHPGNARPISSSANSRRPRCWS